jgi:hypothetical protein
MRVVGRVAGPDIHVSCDLTQFDSFEFESEAKDSSIQHPERSVRNKLTSIYNRQCHRLLITSLPFKPPAISLTSSELPSATDPTKLSLIISPKNTGKASSSRYPGISIDICTHSPCPETAAEPSSPSRFSASPCCARLRESSVSAARMVFSTEALTPTIACVPSAKPMRALPFVPGKMLVSAERGRNCVGERPSGRMGLLGRLREV